MRSEGLIVDLFAGGGGASCGIEAALGRPVDIAINHSAAALAVHKANHPDTRHLEADIWEVKPQAATKGRPVALLWASPDCTHFSNAKGDVPRRQDIRSLAWAVVRWAAAVRPRVIMLENVSEFRGWGPLGKDGRPDKARMGFTFRRWRKRLESLGYTVDYRILDASLYGAPTRRRRLFLIARRDGLPIVWPEPSHGPGLLPLRTAAECIDWSLPCPSIFERKRPLAAKTMWRIAEGIRRFVLENPAPFIVSIDQQGRDDGAVKGGDDPLTTVVAKARHAIVTPSILRMAHGEVAPNGVRRRGNGSSPVQLPLPTITGSSGGGGFAVAAPTLIKVNHGKDEARGSSVEVPLSTVTASQRGDALVVPTLMSVGYGERDGQAARVPGLGQPLGTVVAGGGKHALVSAFLAKHFGGVVGIPATQPVSTITAKDHHSLAAATLLRLNHDDNGVNIEAPMPAARAQGNHIAEVRAFLMTYYSSGSQWAAAGKPAPTITALHRLGLVTVEGTAYQIVDIGMRMLEPHELLRAQFGRFASAYDLSAATTKKAKVRLIGNSVCPEVAEAIVRANMVERIAEEVVA